MVEVRKKLMSNTLYLVIGWIGSIIFNFAFQLLAAKTLLPDELGILSTTIGFVAVLASVLIFGMEQTTQRLASFYLGKNKMEYIRSTLWFFFILTISLNMVVILGLVMLSSQISNILKIPQNALLISILILLPFSLSFFFAGILRGYQNMRYLTITAVLGDFFKLVTAGTLLLVGYKLFGFLIGYSVFVLTIFILRVGVIKKFVAKFRFPDFKLIYRYALPSFFTQILWLLLLSGQYLIITIIQSPYATGLFTVGMILSNQIYYIPRIISDALFPITSRLSGSRDMIKQQRNLLNIALKYSLLLSLPLLFFVSIFPTQLIYLVGRPLFFPAADIIPILVTASLFFGISTLLSRTLYAIGKTITFQTISIVFAVFYVLSAVVLTYLFSSLGTSVAYLTTTVLMTIVSLYYLHKYISFKLDAKPIFKILLASFFTYSLLYAISFYTPNLILGGFFTGIFTVLYFVLLYFLNFYTENEIKALDFISEKIPFAERYLKLVRRILLKKINNNAKDGE